MTKIKLSSFQKKQIEKLKLSYTDINNLFEIFFISQMSKDFIPNLKANKILNWYEEFSLKIEKIIYNDNRLKEIENENC